MVATISTQLKCLTLKIIFLLALYSIPVFSQATPTSLKGHLFLIDEYDDYELVVKFKSASIPLLDDQGVVTPRSNGLAKQTAIEATLRYSRVAKLTAQEIAQLSSPTACAKKTEGSFNILNFAGLMNVTVPNADKYKLLAIAKELEARDDVEYCALKPKRQPVVPSTKVGLAKSMARTKEMATPDYSSKQGYLNADTALDVRYAWSLGLDGSGITLSDIEYDWNFNHEDLIGQDVAHAYGYSPGWSPHHGTAVVGMIAAAKNGIGIDGAAPKTKVRTYSTFYNESSADVAAAVLAAVKASKAGDVILFELGGINPEGGKGPLDVTKDVWDIVKSASDAGITVVAASGNKAEDMDGNKFTTYRSWGDNGAIIVGQGSPDRLHNANGGCVYGSRVNLQGWGSRTVTLGTGDLNPTVTDTNMMYTNNFGGTSGGAAMIASAVILIQQYAIKQFKKPLTPIEMRDLLVSTGLPQGTGGKKDQHIGPFPNIRNAIEKLSKTTAIQEAVTLSKASKLITAKRNGSYLFIVPHNVSSKVELFDFTGRQVNINYRLPR